MGVARACHAMGVSRSGYYAWQNREETPHQRTDTGLKASIQELHQGFRRAYGAPRIHKALRQQGISCSRRRINRLMREMGIKASTTGLYQWRPGQHEFYSGTGNLLAECDAPTGPGQQWVGDFTYIKTRAGWIYLAAVLDLWHRKIVGWSVSRSRNTLLTQEALRMALSRESIEPGCLFHSDQGIEYAAHDFRELVESAGMRRSMSRKGNPIDNATMESFFHTLKAEVIHQQLIQNEVEAVALTGHFIHFYNHERLHSGLGYASPVEYERLKA